MPITAKTKQGVVKEEMHNFKKGDLHSGKNGPVVRTRQQAIAIALSAARKRNYQ